MFPTFGLLPGRRAACRRTFSFHQPVTRKRDRTPVPGSDHPPPWRPHVPRRVEKVALARWHQRHVAEPDDHRAASCPTTTGPVTWAHWKRLWIADEQRDVRCQLEGCGSPLVVTGWFSSALTGSGMIHRTCSKHLVRYHDWCGHRALVSWVRAGLVDERLAWLTTVTIGFGSRSGRSAPGDDVPKHLLDFTSGRWSRRVPPNPGSYLVASIDGRAAQVLDVSIDAETGATDHQEHRGQRVWWWPNAVPAGWSLDRDAGPISED